MAASEKPQAAKPPSPSSNGATSSNAAAVNQQPPAAEVLAGNQQPHASEVVAGNQQPHAVEAVAGNQQPPAAAVAAAAGENANNSMNLALRHNPGISVDWSAEEQCLLEELLTRYASDTKVMRYAKIAMKLKDKTVRDVALRCRWMSKKENGKRRKDDNSCTRKSKEKKEKVLDSSAKAMSKPGVSPYAPPVLPLDTDDGISYKDIGGVTGELLEQNAQMFNQISANFSAFQIHDNVNLLCKARDNILTIMNDLKDMPEIMKQMPSLPVKVNEELANSILPRSAIQMKT